jgi:flagellar hook-basal body complex protein FliE
MDGFTVSRSNKWLESSGMRDSKSLSINDSSLPSAGGAGGIGGVDSTQKSFSDTLKDALGSVNELQKTSDKAAQELATGKTDNVADVMIATEKADIALRLMVQVRNKIIDAYQEVMKMQV